MKSLKNVLLFFISLLSCSSLYAQTEGPYTDTVIIEKPPVVIRQKVHVESKETEFYEEDSKWKAGVYYVLGNSTLTKSSIQSTSSRGFQNLGIEISRKLGPFEIGTGLGIFSTSISLLERKERNYGLTEEKVIKDTLDCYTEMTPEGVRTYCFTKDSIVKGNETRTENYEEKSEKRVVYLQIPLSLSVNFFHKNFYLRPAVQLLYGLRVKNVEELRSQLWFLGGQLNLGYFITSQLMVEVKTQLHETISSIYKDSSNHERWSMAGIGLGLAYKF